MDKPVWSWTAVRFQSNTIAFDALLIPHQHKTTKRIFLADGMNLLQRLYNRWFPSSKTCSNCHYPVAELPLSVRSWTCPHCHTHHDHDENAVTNIRAEGIRMLKVSRCVGRVPRLEATGAPVRVSGTGTSADGGGSALVVHQDD